MTGVLLAYATVSCDADRWAVSLIIQIGLQGSLMVLATVERANDGYPFGLHGNGDHGTLCCWRDAVDQGECHRGGWAGALMWEGLHPLAIRAVALRDDDAGFALSSLGTGMARDVAADQMPSVPR